MEKTGRMESEVYRILKSISQTEADVAADTRLREDLGLDSFASLMVMNELDQAFGIEIVDDDFQELSTASDVVRLLRERYLGDKAE